MPENSPSPGIVTHPSLDERLAAEARDAFAELWDRVVEKAEGTGDRFVSRKMVKEAVEARLKAYLGDGVLPPIVEVKVNAMQTGFDISIRPAPLQAVVRQSGES